MSSPDLLQQYVDLTVYDRSPQDLVDRALVDAASKFPGWVPRAGNKEVVQLEAIALVIAELIYGVNRVPAAVTEILVRLFGVERSNGAAATATATFTLTDAAGHTVPAGTHVRLDLDDGTALVFTTDADLVVAPAATEGTVAITADTATDVANGAAVATALSVLDPISFVESAELATTASGGTNPEDVGTYLQRAVQRFARLTDTLVLARHFTAAALDDVRVARATTIDRSNGAGVEGTANGHVAVAVSGAGGAALSGPVKTEIEAALEAKALANLDVHVIDPTVTAVAVTVTVKALAGFLAADVQDAVAAAIDAYLDPDAWDWGGTVRRNELIALIDLAAGVDYVDTLTLPAADVVLAGVAPLANAGAITVTVT